MSKDLELKRHSMAHLMAAAVLKLYPQAKFGIGPVIENGFYYDIDLGDITLSPEDLPKIQKLMKEMIKEKIIFERKELSLEEAVKIFKAKGQDYKLELLKDLKEKGTTLLDEIEELDSPASTEASADKVDKVSIYTTGGFVDLCRGPHVEDSKKLKSLAFKLTKLTGAYWRGDEKNKMLTRIYAVAFETKEELKEYLENLAEAEKRDHRKLGKELDLFSFHEEGPGFPFFHDKGTFMCNALIDFMRSEMKKRNYEENKTPIILNEQLWRTSGHWDHYRDNMYFIEIDENNYAIKPMNCPGNLLIYKTKPHSYRELPIKAGEFGLVHRHEKTGVLNGLFRVRNFTQDDAHIFCTEKQLKDQLIELLDFIDFIYKSFGFEYSIELSTKPKKAIGSQEIWDKSEIALKDALDDQKIDYKLNEGDGAFYGPKIDFYIKDAIGRTWQCGTIQLDFSMPEKFKLEYIGEDGEKHQPVMIHRAIYGSLERFLGILIEHYAGAFPLWLSPIQVKIISVGGDHVEYCQKLAQEFEDNNIRVEIDSNNETVGNKIRKAVKERSPYMLVIGDKEMNSDKLAVRVRGSENVVEIKQDEFIEKIKNLVKDKSLKLYRRGDASSVRK